MFNPGSLKYFPYRYIKSNKRLLLLGLTDIYFIEDRYILDTEYQRVIIQVRDVNDEPPYFINRPLPMQAVVKLNAPPNTAIFTLQARDPDTDANIHYFLVRDRSK